MRAALAVVAIALLCGAATARAAGDLGFEWSVPDELRGGETGVARDPASATAAPTVVRLRAVNAGACTGLRWRLDDEDVNPTPVGGCAFELDLKDHESHKVTLNPGPDEVSADVAAKDFLVASIGDSVASGEGNPDPPFHWLEPRCHRSMQSGAAQAVLALERADRHSEISFLPVACSGASIEEGILGPYAGIEHPSGAEDLPAQIESVSALAPHHVDALLLSVGANDVNFGPLAVFCVRARDCPNQRFDARDPAHVAHAPARTAAEVEKAALASLPGEYDKLAAALDEAKIEPERVIIVDYFDPLRDRDGAVCPHALQGALRVAGDIDHAEAAWAETHVLAPLRAEVQAAADRHHWRLVSGVADAFATHGICVHGRDRWVRLPFEASDPRAWLSGTLHPNGRGHLATAALIEPVLASTLGDADEIGLAEVAGTSDDEGGGVPIWTLAIALVVGLAAGFGIRSLMLRRH